MTGRAEGEVIVRSALLSDMIAAPEVKAMGGRAAHRPTVDTQVLEPFTRAGCWHRALVELVGGTVRSSRRPSTDRGWSVWLRNLEPRGIPNVPSCPARRSSSIWRDHHGRSWS